MENEAVRMWNEIAKELGLSQVMKLTKARKARLKARLKDCDGLEGWQYALTKMANTPWMIGENARGWKANFDFMLQESSFVKLMEGAYEPSTKQTTCRAKPIRNQTGFESLLQSFEEPDTDHQSGLRDNGVQGDWNPARSGTGDLFGEG